MWRRLCSEKFILDANISSFDCFSFFGRIGAINTAMNDMILKLENLFTRQLLKNGELLMVLYCASEEYSQNESLIQLL